VVYLSLLDNEVSVDENRLLELAIRYMESSEEPTKCIPLFSQPSTKKLLDFVMK